jgi:Mn-dependent DtxR family transcriptional regulator
MGRSWKTDDWDFLNRLHKSGYIDDLVSKPKSVMLTDEGAEQSKRLFRRTGVNV